MGERSYPSAGCGLRVAALVLSVLLLASCGSSRDENPAGGGSNTAVQLAWTVARAEKCGFVYQPNMLVSNWLNHEGRTGGDIGARRQAYEFAYRRFQATLAKNPKYCNDKRIAETRRDLNRHMEGDYSPGLPPSVEEE